MAADVQVIKDKIDIVDLIGEYVQLKPSGINHKGLCPFHHEKSPSFMVHRDRQFWHCFGCAKGGDIFSFIQEMEGMDFVEALKLLAQRAGIPLTTLSADTNTSQKNRIKEINTEAARFFHAFLLKMPASKPALEYLARRGVRPETIEAWQIGFVPDQWDLLTKYLLKKGFAIDDMVAAGLTATRDGANKMTLRGFYDRFRGRIMFPIWDVHGTVVGFTGRILVETENSGGKYVNTPQTIVYDKSRVVFGLNKAKQEIKAKNYIVMVEGQMDVIACHQAGMTNVVASSGTAMTEEQVHLLKRYSPHLKIAFDADAAGQNAADRGIDVALLAGMSIEVITIPEGAGKDADECLKKNPEVWFSAVAQAQNIMEYYFAKAFLGKQQNNPRDKQDIANRLLPKVNQIPFAVERDHWLRLLSERLGTDVSVLREDMERLAKQQKLKTPAASLTQRQAPAAPVPVVEAKTRLDTLVERLYALLLKFPDQGKTSLDDSALGLVLSTLRGSALYEELKKQYTQSGTISLDLLRNAVPSDNSRSSIDLLLLAGEKDFSTYTPSQAGAEALQLGTFIKIEWAKERRRVLQQDIANAERSGDMERLKMLLAEFQRLVS